MYAALTHWTERSPRARVALLLAAFALWGAAGAIAPSLESLLP